MHALVEEVDAHAAKMQYTYSANCIWEHQRFPRENETILTTLEKVVAQEQVPLGCVWVVLCGERDVLSMPSPAPVDIFLALKHASSSSVPILSTLLD